MEALKARREETEQEMNDWAAKRRRQERRAAERVAERLEPGGVGCGCWVGTGCYLFPYWAAEARWRGMAVLLAELLRLPMCVVWGDVLEFAKLADLYSPVSC